MSVICPKCGKELSEAESKSVHTCKPAEQAPAEEFTKALQTASDELKTAEKACADDYIWGNMQYARELIEGTITGIRDRLDAQQQEIESLKAEIDERQEGYECGLEEISRLTAENKKNIADFNDILNRSNKTIDRLTAENKAQAERIEDYARRILSHVKGESVEGECRTCGKRFWYVDDEPIACPFCHPERVVER